MYKQILVPIDLGNPARAKRAIATAASRRCATGQCVAVRAGASGNHSVEALVGS
jgi:hypothetical protein